MKKRISIVVVLSALLLVCPTNINGIQKASSVPQISQAATIGQKNALKKAKDYIKYLALSKKELLDYLEDDGFTKKECNYGVKHCRANWKKECLQKAKDYMKYLSLSKSELYDYLEDDGFTKAQIQYAVNKVYD